MHDSVRANTKPKKNPKEGDWDNMMGQALGAPQNLNDAAFVGLLPGSDSAGHGFGAQLGNSDSKGSGPGFSGPSAPSTPAPGGAPGNGADFSGSGKKSKKRGRQFDILDDSAAAREVAKKDLGDLSNPLSTLIANLETAIGFAEKSPSEFPKSSADCVEMKKIVASRLVMLKASNKEAEVSY